jgi:RNA recognition motif-containing protein
MLSISHQVNFGKGCAFISFARKPEAARAIERLNGLVLDGKPLRVTWSRSSGMSLIV